MKYLKKILYVVLILFLTECFLLSPAFAGTKDLKFAWEQAVSPDLAKWNLYYSETSNGPYALFTSIIYNGEPGPQFASDPIVFTSPDGQKVTYYFVLTAVDIEDNESIYSNEASTTIDFEIPEAPFSFTVTVIAN